MNKKTQIIYYFPRLKDGHFDFQECAETASHLPQNGWFFLDLAYTNNIGPSGEIKSLQNTIEKVKDQNGAIVILKANEYVSQSIKSGLLDENLGSFSRIEKPPPIFASSAWPSLNAFLKKNVENTYWNPGSGDLSAWIKTFGLDANHAERLATSFPLEESDLKAKLVEAYQEVILWKMKDLNASKEEHVVTHSGAHVNHYYDLDFAISRDSSFLNICVDGLLTNIKQDFKKYETITIVGFRHFASQAGATLCNKLHLKGIKSYFVGVPKLSDIDFIKYVWSTKPNLVILLFDVICTGSLMRDVKAQLLLGATNFSGVEIITSSVFDIESEHIVVPNKVLPDYSIAKVKHAVWSNKNQCEDCKKNDEPRFETLSTVKISGAECHISIEDQKKFIEKAILYNAIDEFAERNGHFYFPYIDVEHLLSFTEVSDICRQAFIKIISKLNWYFDLIVTREHNMLVGLAESIAAILPGKIDVATVSKDGNWQRAPLKKAQEITRAVLLDDGLNTGETSRKMWKCVNNEGNIQVCAILAILDRLNVVQYTLPLIPRIAVCRLPAPVIQDKGCFAPYIEQQVFKECEETLPELIQLPLWGSLKLRYENIRKFDDN